MPGNAATSPADCNCFAIRSAARHVSQLYDQILAPTGLRTTQFSILAHLKKGPRTISARRAKVGRHCRFRSKVTFHRASGRLRFIVRFGGNRMVAPGHARTVRVRAGRRR